MTRFIVLLITHMLAAAIGFAAGIYALPILTAPPAPTDAEVAAVAAQAQFTGEFRRDLADSDALHWGEGIVSIGQGMVSLQGRIAPGPDYKLYLSPEFVQTEADFIRLKQNMVQVGDVKTFENFVVALPASIDPSAYNSVIVWCESFGEFITAAEYR
ncbi:MAG: DM13 domain-containing protein [Sedimenticolaceae bacterium]